MMTIPLYPHQWRGPRYGSALLLGVVWVLCSGAQAMSFSQALDAALANDATYRAAGFEYDAARFGVPIARAQLLPAVSLTAGEGNVTGSRRFPNGQNQEVRVPLDYNTPQASLNLRMPLFNFEAISNLRQARAQTEVAEAVFRTRGMDLMERLASAYMQTLLAEDVRRLAEAQVKGYEVQAGQTEQRLRRGEGTRVQVAQVQATLDVARTRLLETLDQVEIARLRLERLTGVDRPSVNALSPAHTASPLFPERLGDWLEMAVRQSPTLQARERNREVARQATRRQQAGHLPRLDLVASLARNENDSTNNIGQSTTLRTVGVQLSVPIFSGGGVDAGVKRAVVLQALVEEEVRTEREAIEVDVQRHYLAVVNSEKKVAAYAKAVESTALAVQGTRRAVETGLGTNAELAEAQSANSAAARDLAQTRIETLLSKARLMMRAGMPLNEVAMEIDRTLIRALEQPAAPSVPPPATTPATAKP